MIESIVFTLIMAVLSVLIGGLAVASVVAGAPAPSSSSSPDIHYYGSRSEYQRHNQHRSGNHFLMSRAPAVALAEHTLPLVRNVVPREGRSARPRLWQNWQNANQNWNSRFASSDTPGNDTTPSNSTKGAEPPVSVGLAPSANYDIEYITQVLAGSNNLSIVVDTGSSDTWFIKQGFSCVSARDHRAALAATCGFGPAFKGDFPGGAIANKHLSVAYGNGQGPFMQAQLGYSDLTVSGITAEKQVIGLATRGYWQGDGITSGLLGLGLPALTNWLPGAPSTTYSGDMNDRRTVSGTYDPFVSTLSKANNVTQFSLALSRDPEQSFLAFGGAPPNIEIDSSIGWITTPIVKTSSALKYSPDSGNYMFYTITVDSFQFNSSELKRSTLQMDNLPLKQVPLVVDSGTTLNLFSYDVALAINQLFTPRAQFDGSGAWQVKCDAIPPSFGVVIGNKTIWADPKSMILPAQSKAAAEANVCMSGIGANAGEPYILGDTFMQQLVSVFDLENMEIKFARRADLPATKSGSKTTPAASPSPTRSTGLRPPA